MAGVGGEKAEEGDVDELEWAAEAAWYSSQGVEQEFGWACPGEAGESVASLRHSSKRNRRGGRSAGTESQHSL